MSSEAVDEILKQTLDTLELVGRSLAAMAAETGVAFDGERFKTLIERARRGDVLAGYEIGEMFRVFEVEGEQFLKVNV